MDHDDEILDEYDIFVNTELSSFLHIIPLPTSTLSTRFNSPKSSSFDTPNAVKFKPQARKLEMILSNQDLLDGNFCGERVGELQMDSGQKLVGSGWPWRKVQYLLGHFSDGELHVTPVESVIPLNPCLSHLDDFDARSKNSSSTSAASSGNTSRRSHSNEDVTTATTTTTTTTTTTNATANTATTTAKTIQLQFRKKETEEQVQARLNSFAHLQRKIDDESWINLKHFNPQDQEVSAVKDKLIGSVREALEFLPDEDYLDKVINYERPQVDGIAD